MALRRCPVLHAIDIVEETSLWPLFIGLRARQLISNHQHITVDTVVSVDAIGIVEETSLWYMGLNGCLQATELVSILHCE